MARFNKVVVATRGAVAAEVVATKKAEIASMT